MTEVGPCTKTLSTKEGDITIYSLRELEAKGIIKDLSNCLLYTSDAADEL